ncbi:uncharacterized protein BXZ73DRAFT_89477 [Epithele typhae]|uniref:uncharacterized protein n=1 Tax=Epithele typhae TaxID=378194 RepID=UPI002008BCDD|nr:uncharacterized protein BXZ73DRAFT_89477 [Epithele typhae]KAH9935996.1 hypothetical protein BXZ73DRAFT_89477 [Epithele typhae]
MTALHAYFHQRNQQAFQRLLDPARNGSQASGGGPSTSGGKSWSRPSPLSAAASASTCDVNARDGLSRTVLHLAASSSDPSAPEFVRLLLGHPGINVNIADTESHWTPLHRALYNGNLAAAQLLLQRSDIDVSARDIEGYTPFDLYNSTIEETIPDHDFLDFKPPKDLFTWGSNRNAALGVGDGDDRAFPELVSLRVVAVDAKEHVDTRFTPIRVRQVAMSRLHTVIVTDEPRGNLRVCGFGSGGRLGPGQHTQFTPIPIPGFNQTVESVAVGQDHTLVLTTTGEVYSWGLNRFSQLGYVIETATGARPEEPIQTTPRKIAGAIKNQETASACWSRYHVYAWGTNNGQLGFDKNVQPVQSAPRVVTKVARPVLSVSITDNAMACLLDTQEVFVCGITDASNFPAYSFPSEFTASSASIDKITSCEDAFAALSSSGELFTFHLHSPPEGSSTSTKARFNVQPQRVWALRKRFSAVRDVAIGMDGSIIICTESGHVFVRSRNLKAGQGASVKTFKFQRVPHVQRITQVSANATGAFAALRYDWRMDEVSVYGNLFPQDLAVVQPYLRMNLVQYSPVGADVGQIRSLCSVIVGLKAARKATEGAKTPDFDAMPLDADLIVHVQSTGINLPAHRVILAARSSQLHQALSEGKTFGDHGISVQGHVPKPKTTKTPKLTFGGCHPLTVLILLVFLYTDEPLAVWDPRITTVNPTQIKAELQSLASVLGLTSLSDVLGAPVKRAVKPTLVRDMQQLFSSSQDQTSGIGARAQRPLAPDVVLQLADRDVSCHSVILRARSPFFTAFFNDHDWTRNRWTPEGSLLVNLKHMKWRAVEPALKYILCGNDKEIFSVVEDVRSADELIDFMFEVMAVAAELHIDRLMLICSWVIMKRVSINNVSSVLTDATHYHADALVELVQEYMSINMEVFLANHMLDDLTSDLVKQLSAFKYPITRSTHIVDKAMETWGNWLALQDIPQPILSPPGTGKRQTRRSDASAPNSPILRPTFSTRPQMFMMDDPEPSRQPSGSESPARPLVGWRTISAPKTDMKTIIAEASTSKIGGSPGRAPAGMSARSSEPFPPGTPPRPSMDSPSKTAGATPRTPSGSWRIPQQAGVHTPPSGSPAASSSIAFPGRDGRTPSSGPSAVPGPSGIAQGSAVRPPAPQQPSPRKPPAPGLGPVFTPTKQAGAGASSIRRVSSGSVWTPPPVQPVVQPSAPSPSASTMSFAAIQRAQEAQNAPAQAKDKRSLVQIQEEEQARRVEEDFLRWWTEEEERLREEERATAALLTGEGGTGEQPQRPKKSRKGKAVAGAAPAAPGGKGEDNRPPRKAALVQDGAQGQAQGGKSRRRKPAHAHGKDDVHIRKEEDHAQS